MGDLHRLSNSEHFVDDRGVGLRATWHPEGSVIVVSVWHGQSCAGSLRLPIGDAPRLANLLLTSVSEWASFLAAEMSTSKTVNGD